ncbi:MAG: heavy metal-associated domain-containing protein [Cyanobacteria bacterium P01_F01_bin.150]
METQQFNVEGITCPACVDKVETAALQLPGVIDCVVDYDEKRATVQFNPQKSSLDRLQQGLTKAGYRATPFAVAA